jgi:hypothetical protein
MAIDEKRSNVERRSGKDQRSGINTRTGHSTMDRRSSRDRRSINPSSTRYDGRHDVWAFQLLSAEAAVPAARMTVLAGRSTSRAADHQTLQAS